MAALGIADFVGVLDIWVPFGFTLILGVVDAGVQPFRLAFISAIVPKSRLNAAVAIRSVKFNIACLLGPAVAGLVIATFGVGWAFATHQRPVLHALSWAQ